MDTGMLFAAYWMKSQLNGAGDDAASLERETDDAYRLVTRFAGAIAAIAIAVLALDGATERVATTQGACHDCIADNPIPHNPTPGRGADLAWADAARGR